jgi:Winged helix-turn helix
MGVACRSPGACDGRPCGCRPHGCSPRVLARLRPRLATGQYEIGVPVAATLPGRRRDGAGIERAGPGDLPEALAQRLRAAVTRGPAAHGWADQRGTLARVTTLVGRLSHVRSTPRGVSYLLHRIGFSPITGLSSPPRRWSIRLWLTSETHPESARHIYDALNHPARTLPSCSALFGGVAQPVVASRVRTWR